MILLVGDSRRADVVHGIAQVEPLVRELADEVRVDLDGNLDLQAHPPRLVFNFGGDGSILHIASRLGRRQVPILGVNFGKFGFLAEYELPELLDRLEDALQGRLPTRASLLLLLQVTVDGKTDEHVVVNDVVLQRAPDQRMATIQAFYNDERIADYFGDGLIVSTPIGSTAYSLASGGALLHPLLNAVTLTPLSPHTLTLRPLVAPAEGIVTLKLGGDETTTLSMDGRGARELKSGDVVTISRAPMPMTLVAHPTRGYFDTLRRKFNWSRR